MQGKVISGNQRDTDHAHLEQLAHHVGAIELVGHLMREAIRRSLEAIRGTDASEAPSLMKDSITHQVAIKWQSRGYQEAIN